jgi:protein-tyrosine-phosphatase
MKERYLFVCSGNTCRSAMAEKYAQSLGLTAASAGTWATEGKQMNPYAAIALRKAGIPNSKDHKAKLVAEKALRWATIVLCMDVGHIWELQDKFPEAINKTFMLRRDGSDIADPFGSEQKIYDETLALIRTSIDTGLRSGFKPLKLGMR